MRSYSCVGRVYWWSEQERVSSEWAAAGNELLDRLHDEQSLNVTRQAAPPLLPASPAQELPSPSACLSYIDTHTLASIRTTTVSCCQMPTAARRPMQAGNDLRDEEDQQQ